MPLTSTTPPRWLQAKNLALKGCSCRQPGHYLVALGHLVFEDMHGVGKRGKKCKARLPYSIAARRHIWKRRVVVNIVLGEQLVDNRQISIVELVNHRRTSALFSSADIGHAPPSLQLDEGPRPILYLVRHCQQPRAGTTPWAYKIRHRTCLATRDKNGTGLLSMR